MTEAYEGLDVCHFATPPTLSVPSGIESPPVSEFIVALECWLDVSDPPLNVASGVSFSLLSGCSGLDPVGGVYFIH